MSFKTIVRWTCDLCSTANSNVTDDVKTLPPGWLLLEYSHRPFERDCLYRHICKECAEEIIHTIQQQKFEQLSENPRKAKT